MDCTIESTAHSEGIEVDVGGAHADYSPSVNPEVGLVVDLL